MTTAANECQELKNIQYKTMLLSGQGGHIVTNTASNLDLSGVGMILERESKRNKKEPWSKINKTAKIVKLNEYAAKLAEEKSLNKPETLQLKRYLLSSLDRKRLVRVKDVTYDKETGKITDIPCLSFNPSSRKFTLKRNDKRTSTLKSLGHGRSTRKKQSKEEKIDGDIKDNLTK